MKKSHYVKAGINLTAGVLLIFGSIIMALRFQLIPQCIIMVLVGVFFIVIGGFTAKIPLEVDKEDWKALLIANQILFVILCVFFVIGIIGNIAIT